MANQSSQGLLSPFLQSQRFNAARPYIRGSVLDIGCGNGRLARYCQPTGYYGFDIHPDALSAARADHPGYRFESALSPAGDVFDTISALAVIEHLPDPGATLNTWASYMKPDGAMVLTTPLPALEWAHELGAKVGIFSHDAAEEHEVLLDRRALEALLVDTPLKLTAHRKFLGGANQLFILGLG